MWYLETNPISKKDLVEEVVTRDIAVVPFD
jgi:hypothetical protein